MPYTGRRHGVVLACGLIVISAAALAPAGLQGDRPPVWAWGLWTLSFATALWAYHKAGLPIAEALRRITWLMPVVAVFALPAAMLAPTRARGLVALTLSIRALAAAGGGAGIATWLGPSGIVSGTRQLGAPQRLADVLEATLASLSTVLRQVRAMLQAREARRTTFGAWSDLLTEPADTVRGFGRLVAALLLRSLERAEALERARRARGLEP
jgi:energy-coupling factor transporter transmembrane protein EcfT